MPKPPASSNAPPAPSSAAPPVPLRALPWLLLAGALVALVLSRSAETMGEVDRYGEAAERLLAGELVPDPFHPYGCRLAIAAIMLVTGLGSLHAGAILAALGALAFARGTAALAERLRPGAGMPAAWLAGTNAIVWTQGTTVSADMPAAGLFVLGTALAAGKPRRPGLHALGVGALLGLAATMHTALLGLLVPALLIAMWRSGSLGTAAAALLGALLGYLPQLVPAALLGTGVLGESWQTLYLKTRFDFDAGRLLAEQQAGTLRAIGEFLLADWRPILTNGLHDLTEAIDSVLPAMMLGTEPTPGLPLWWLPSLALLGLLSFARQRGLARLIAAFLGAQLALVCFTFHPISRVLLPSLAVLLIGVALPLGAITRARLRAAAIACVSGILLLLGAPMAARFVDSQPLPEIAVARRIPDLVDGPVAVLATYSLLDRYVAYPTFRIQRPPPAAYRDSTTAWQTLRARIEQSGANVLLVGRRSDARAFAALRTASAAEGFRWRHRDDDVLVAELQQATSDWIASLEVRPRTATAGQSCTFTVQLSAAADRDAIAGVGIAFRSPDGTQTVIDLPPGGVDRFARQTPLPTPGEWRLAPVILRRDGGLLRGAERRLTVTE